MKKELIKLGDKLFWDGKQDNVAVTVIDLSMIGNTVGIADGGITHVVDARNLQPIPAPQVAQPEQTLSQLCPVNKPVEEVSPLPQIKKYYDEKTSSLFIVINGKTTMCIPHVSKGAYDCLGISYKHDDDSYNQEIGQALAHYRSTCAEHKMQEKQVRKMPPLPFPLFL